jgi:uncharacterized protein
MKGFGAEPGTVTTRSLVASEMPGGIVELPLRIICGAKPGPCLAVTAGVHGSEYCAIVAAHRLARELNPVDLHGTIAIIPLVTKSAYESRTRWVNPVDGVNPNRAFPGKQEASVSYQIAYTVFNELISKADAYVDMHGGDLMESLAPHVLFNETGRLEVDKTSESMAVSFGVQYIWKIPREERGTGGAFTETAFSGIPSMLSEVGEDGKLDPTYVDIQYNGIINVMKSLGIIEGNPEKADFPIISTKGKFLLSKRGGMFYSQTRTGQLIKENQLIGVIKTLEGDVVEEIRSPFNAVVLAIVNNPSVKKSDITFEILAV